MNHSWYHPWRLPVHRLLLATLLAVTARGGAADQPVKVSGGILALPPMIIEAQSSPLHWYYLELPGFELLTVCSETTSLGFARRNHRLGELLHVLVPERYLFKSSVPEAHILFNEETGRARSPEVIAEMLRGQGAIVGSDGTVTLPEEMESVPPVFGPRIPLSGMAPRRVFFLPNMRLTDTDTQGIFSIMHENAPAQGFSFAEDRVQFLLERRAPALPAWLVEGLMGLYRQSRLLENEITVKPAVWLSEAESTALARDPERPRLLLPLQELFTRPRPGPNGTASTKDRVWRAQCALFVRWVVAEQGGARQAAFWKFVDRLETEPLSEELFRECFGLGFADMRDRLSDSLAGAVSRPLELDAPKGESLPQLKLRQATDAEIARIRGDWERMEINYVHELYPALTARYVEQARTTLRRAYDRGERDARLLAVLGLTELEAGDKATARDFLEAAVRGGKVRPRAYIELARLRYEALPAGEAKLTAAQAAGVREPLRLALQNAPPLIEAYALLATVWLRSPTGPDAAELALLSEGARLFPRASAYVLRVIYFTLAGGQAAVARPLAEAGLREAREPAMQERFKRVLAELTVMGL